MIRVLIIEDEIIIARYVQQLLLGNFDWEVKIAVNMEEAGTEMREFRPQLVLCDVNLRAKIDGIDLIAGFQKNFLFETIFITSYQSEAMIQKASLTRPANYILKPLDEVQFLATLKMTGSRLRPDGPQPKPVSPTKDLLTRSEYEVLQLIAGNLSTRDIAGSLHISPLTVKNHRHNICRKLNLPPENNSILKWAMENRGQF
jgi:DNA-binding NarL/FixJ family response regulator